MNYVLELLIKHILYFGNVYLSRTAKEQFFHTSLTFFAAIIRVCSQFGSRYFCKILYKRLGNNRPEVEKLQTLNRTFTEFELNLLMSCSNYVHLTGPTYFKDYCRIFIESNNIFKSYFKALSSAQTLQKLPGYIVMNSLFDRFIKTLEE